MSNAFKFIVIFLSCILLGVGIAHPLGYTIMYLDEYEVDRAVK